MKVKELLKLIKYKDTIIRINIQDDYFEYTKGDSDLISDYVLNYKIDEIIPLERRLEIYVKEN